MGTFFVIPVYLQVVLGFDAFETGKRLLPLSLAMLVFALLGPRIAGRRSPRTVAQIGLVGVSIGALVMLGTLDVTLNDPGFKIALGLIGAGAGLLASQLGNVIMSAVAPTQTSEAGGLQEQCVACWPGSFVWRHLRRGECQCDPLRSKSVILAALINGASLSSLKRSNLFRHSLGSRRASVFSVPPAAPSSRGP